MKHTIILNLLLIALLLVSCNSKKDSDKQVQYVKTITIADASKFAEVNFPGRTKAIDDINVAFRVSGPISRILVHDGDHVSKGQVIATMDPRDYQVQLNATKAEYEQVKADAERIIALYQEGNTTASNYDKARYGLTQITQKLNNHRNQLADTQLRAPMNGYIQDVLHEAGETVSAGLPVISMFGSSALEVEISISAYDYANRDRLNSAYCVFDLLPGEKFPLKVASISAEANASQLYTVRFQFAGPYDKTKITPGMTTIVYATVDNDAVDNQLIPVSAILEEEGTQYVYVYIKETGTVKKINVAVKRLHNDGMAEISAGLHDSDEVVVAGVHHLTDGMKVTPLPKTSKSNVGGLL